MIETKIPETLKPKPSDISSKDDSPPAEQHIISDEEKHITEMEEAYHKYEEHVDEEIELEW